MLLPRIHAWAPLRKWLVVIAAAIALAAFGALVYNYERYHRGPTDSVLVGTWEVPVWPGLGDVYFRLDADHTFHISHDFRDEQSEFDHGVWHAGGDFAYLRHALFDQWGNPTNHPLEIWRLENISPAHLQIRYNPGGALHTFRRVDSDSPNASNQTLQPTAGRRDE